VGLHVWSQTRAGQRRGHRAQVVIERRGVDDERGGMQLAQTQGKDPPLRRAAARRGIPRKA
jgi:hypothetical protein